MVRIIQKSKLKLIILNRVASEAVQKASKCLIGKDYPLAMINHVTASRTNMERMKQVYQQLAKYRNCKLLSML